MTEKRVESRPYFQESGIRPTIERFLDERFFQKFIAPSIDRWRKELLASVERGEVIQGMKSKDELSLNHKSLSEMPLCGFWKQVKHLVPEGFEVLLNNGAVHLNGDVVGTEWIDLVSHTFLYNRQEESFACPVAGQFFWYDKGYAPGEVIRNLHEFAPSLVYPVGNGCGVLYGHKDAIEKQLGLTFLTGVYVVYFPR